MKSFPLIIALAGTPATSINDLTPVSHVKVPEICSAILHELTDAIANKVITPTEAHEVYIRCTEVFEI